MRALLLLPLLALPLFAQDVPPPFENKAPAAVVSPGEDKDQELDPFDPTGEAPRMIHVQVEWIELPHETVTDLLLNHPLKTAAATELRLEVQKLVKARTASVLETQMTVARSGEKATAESIAEYIYPTEYEPVRGIPETAAAQKAHDEKERELFWPPVPTSFETRNLGSILEIEPTSAMDHRLIDLRLAPEFSWQTGRTVWQERKDENGNTIKIEMPEIYSLQVVTALTLRPGVHSLAGILSPKDQNGRTDPTRKVMIFVKADNLVVP